jgi:catechol 2,3-dioxygenase-like lactoylglutathione lyase family enzyme
MTDETSTCGVDHIGLSVRDLESTRKFFCDCLGWRIVGARADYPAVFVSDGHDIVTLWQVESPSKAIPFDRRANVGLHHLASPSPIR